MSVLEKALELANQGYSVFPLVTGTKIPPKGHHGYLEASKDPQQVSEWFNDNPTWNLGLSLAASGLIVVDIDLHSTDKNGMQSIKKLAAKGNIIPGDTYIERTPHNGLHYFFKATGDDPLTNQVNAWPGIDLITNFTVVSPSEIGGIQYTSIATGGLSRALYLPDWLAAKLVPERRRFSPSKRVRNHTGKLLDDMATGVTGKGTRDNWLTSIVGRMVAAGASPESVYQLACTVNNEYISPPLEGREVSKIFNSVLRKEARQFGKENTRRC